MCSHRTSASALSLRKEIMDLQLYYSGSVALAMALENGSRLLVLPQ